MKFGTIAAAVAALTLSASPVLAQSNAARAPAPVEAPSQLGNDDDDGADGSAIILALLAAAAIIAGIVIAVDGDDDEAISR